MGRIREFFKKETVLCVAAVCAVGTMFLVPPDGAYIGYIDLPDGGGGRVSKLRCLPLAGLPAAAAQQRRTGPQCDFGDAALFQLHAGDQ